jgi:hypothetical protein
MKVNDILVRKFRLLHDPRELAIIQRQFVVLEGEVSGIAIEVPRQENLPRLPFLLVFESDLTMNKTSVLVDHGSATKIQLHPLYRRQNQRKL